MTPDQYTIQETFLEVGDSHTLYVHEWGNKAAETPILFLHGGPGGACRDRHKQLFDPERQRVIFFDQRGSGRSLPYGSLEHNTTADIVSDIVKILDHLQVKQCVVTGGSWGSALAFFFALAHGDRVRAMVLNGIWTSTKAENDWLDEGGFQTFFPDAWERYVATVPQSHRHDPSAYHFPRILGDDAEAAKASGYAYESLEGAAISLDDRFTADDYETFDPSGIRIEVHYLSNGCFVSDRHILDNATMLTMPIYLVQGRYDMVCPPNTAYALSKLLPKGELILTTSGHKAEREAWNVMRTLLLQLAGS